MLIECPECKTQISSVACSCPSCGYPIAPRVIEQTAKRYKLCQALSVPPLVVGVVLWMTYPHESAPAWLAAGIGLYVYGRVGAWWRHG